MGKPSIRVLNVRSVRTYGKPARIEMTVSLEHLKSRPLVKIPLTEDEAFEIALASMRAIDQSRDGLKERSK